MSGFDRQDGDGGGGLNGLVRLFIRHPNAANLLMALMLLAGLFSVFKINTQFFPSVDRPNIDITVVWSGASAEDVETNVLARIEPEVRFIDGVDRMDSTAREGSGSVNLEFEDGTDMQKALSEVEAAVKAITTLPADAEQPTVSRQNFFDRVAYVSLSGSAPERIKRDWAKRMRDDLIDRGIDKIEFNALREREIRVDIGNKDLRRLGLTIEDVANAVAANSNDLPSGSLEGDIERQLRSLADADSPRAVGSVEVLALPSGEKVYLRDMATIYESFDDDETRGFSEGSVAIELDVKRATSADTLATAAILEDYIDEIRLQLPENLELHVYSSAADALYERIMLLLRNGVGGLILVVIVLFIFLDARVALWVAAGIPIAMLATVGFMYVSGQTINMVSLFGLIMMLGIVVDDAIVVGEHTNTRLEMGDAPMLAAERGVGMMLAPVLAAMTTTIASFAPITLIRDTIGQIMGVLPLVVVAVIIASLLECFFVLPGHLAHSLGARSRPRWSYWRQFFLAFAITALAVGAMSPLAASAGPFARWIGDSLAHLPPIAAAVLIAVLALVAASLVEAVILLVRRKATSARGENRFRDWFDRGFQKLRDGPFDRLVALSYRWRYVTLSIATGLILVIAVGFTVGKRVEFVFFPSPEAESIRGNVSFVAGLPEADAMAAIDRIESAFRDIELEMTDGQEKLATSIVTLFSKASRFGGTSASVKVQLTISENRTVRTSDIVRAWAAAIPDIPGVTRFSIFQSRGGPPGRDIDVVLLGDRVADLKAAAAEIIPVLSSINGVSGVDDNLPFGKPELVVEMLPRGAALGFTAESIGRQLRNAFDGEIAHRFADGDDEVAVRLYQRMRAAGTGALRNFELRSPSGVFVPLTEVAELREQQGFAYISRRDGKTRISITGDIDNEITTTDNVIAELEHNGAVERIASNYGLRYEYAGRSEEQENAFADLRLGLLVALSVIYIILAWVFASYWRPFAVMFIIPFGIVGAVFGHWILGYQLTIVSMAGLLGLSGILVNDSIILVARMDERLADGDSVDQAAIGASRDRFRAVLLTSLTTIGGLLPLLFEKSQQAQFLLPMAITIVFGLAMATLLVLFLVPALMGIGYDIRAAFVALFGHRRAQSPAE